MILAVSAAALAIASLLALICVKLAALIDRREAGEPLENLDEAPTGTSPGSSMTAK